MLYGFVRANGNSPTLNDTLREQRVALVEYGVSVAHIFEDIELPESRSNRPRQRAEETLNGFIESLQEGDTLAVYQLSRIARNARGLYVLCTRLQQRGIELVSIKESFSLHREGERFIAACKLIADMESDVMRERAGISRVRAAQTGNVGGRPKADEEAVAKAMEMYASGEYQIKEIVEKTGLSHMTIHRKAKERGIVRAKKSSSEQDS